MIFEPKGCMLAVTDHCPRRIVQLWEKRLALPLEPHLLSGANGSRAGKDWRFGDSAVFLRPARCWASALPSKKKKVKHMPTRSLRTIFHTTHQASITISSSHFPVQMAQSFSHIAYHRTF